MATPAFASPDDVANHALQMVGSFRISTTKTLATDTQKCAVEVNQCYNKLRQAELRRNTWTFALRRAVMRPVDLTTVLLAYPAFSAVTAYVQGSVAQDTDGVVWQAKQGSTGQTPGVGDYWQHYFGNDYANLFDYTLKTAYFPGEFVVVPATYAGGTTYAINSIVAYSGSYYVSLASSNTGHQPDTSTTWWSTYATWVATSPKPTANVVYVTGAVVYMALQSGVGTLSTDGPGTAAWLAFGGTFSNLAFMYPIGCGPSTDSATRNVFRRPFGYLKEAPNDPKGGNIPWLGAPKGPMPKDWLWEGVYIVSQDAGPLMLRFCADIVDVRDMDPMFCHGLATRIAVQVEEPLTQSTGKKTELLAEYKNFMWEARQVNSIEQGAVEPYTDEYLNIRL